MISEFNFSDLKDFDGDRIVLKLCRNLDFATPFSWVTRDREGLGLSRCGLTSTARAISRIYVKQIDTRQKLLEWHDCLSSCMVPPS